MTAAWPARRVQAVMLLVAAVGILVQIAAGADYPVVPPGIVVLVGAALLLTSVDRSGIVWLGIAVAAHLLIGAVVAPDAVAQLGSPEEGGAFVGTVIQLTAVSAALLIGIGAVRSNERAQ